MTERLRVGIAGCGFVGRKPAGALGDHALVGYGERYRRVT